MRWPPPSSMSTRGMPRRIAIFSMRWVLALPSRPMLPPNTLKSCDRMATGRPSIRAVPVTTPSAGDFSRGCGLPGAGSVEARAPISSKLPGSTRRSMRVRADSRPRSANLFMASGRAASIREARSASMAARICRRPASGWCVMVSPSARRKSRRSDVTMTGLSFSRQLQPRALAAFDAAQTCLLAGDVVARHRHDALALGQLDLDIHHGVLAERRFRRRQIELPHPHEALVIELLGFLGVGEEAFAPGLQGFGIMQ